MFRGLFWYKKQQQAIQSLPGGTSFSVHNENQA